MSSNNSCSLLILFSLILLLNLDLASSISCLTQCGGIDIPYPFGIGKGCYLEKWYEIECVNSSIPGMFEPFLSLIRKQVVSITLPSQFHSGYSTLSYGYGSVLIKNPMVSKGCSTNEENSDSLLNLTGTPFYVGFSNTLIAAGCNNTASLTNVEPSMVGCKSSCGIKNHTASDHYFATINCYNKASLANRMPQFCQAFSATSCNGIGCCKASMPDGVQRVVDVKIEDGNTTTKGCKVAFLTDKSYNMLGGYNPQQIHALRYSNVDLGWFIHTTNHSFIDSLGCQNVSEYNKRVSFDPTTRCICDYNVDLSYASCACSSGYKGNPYVGCQGQ